MRRWSAAFLLVQPSISGCDLTDPVNPHRLALERLAESAEPEATSRGVALLALEALGVLPDLAAVRQTLGETFTPDRAHHARFRDAIERQRRFDERV